MSDKYKNNSNFIGKKNISQYPLFLLTLLMVGTALIVYSKYIFGHSYWIFTDIGSDTWNEYFPVLTMLGEKIKSGDFSSWVTNWGTGVDLINNQSIICDPFNIPLILLYLVGGKWIMAAGLVYVNIAKCFLTGYFTYLWLSEFDLTWYARVIGAYVCAFNGFLILWGQHYFFATACVFMILDIYQLERTIKDQKKSSWLIISVAMTLISSLYTAFTIAVACIAYLALRCMYYVKIWSVKKIIKKIFFIVVDVIIAVLISSIISMPAYYQLTEVSSRIGEHVKVPLFYDALTFRAIFTRMFSNNLFGVANNYIGPLNYYELNQLFFSCFAPAMLVIFFVEKIHYDKKRWVYVILMIITVIMMFLPVGGAICNRFVNTATRYCYVFIPVMAFAIAWIMTYLGELHKSTRIIGACINLMFIILLCVIYNVDSRTKTNDSRILNVYLIVIVISMLIFTFIVALKTDSLTMKSTMKITIGCLIVFSIITDSGLTCLKRYNVNVKSEEKQNVLYTEEALKQTGDNKKILIRTEKTYHDSFFNDALLENYMGISYYNTTFSKYVQSFMSTVWPTTLTVSGNPGYFTYNGDAENINMASLMGIRYVLSKVPMSENYILKGSTAEGINIYENPNSDRLGRIYTSTMSKSDFLSNPQDQLQSILGSTLVLQDDDYNDNVAGEAAQPSTVGIYRGKDSNHMRADVELDTEGFLFIPVTWDRGWSATVNGRKAKIYRADIGFQAVKIFKGNNKIEWEYESPLQKDGVAASVVGIAMLIVISFIRKKKRNITDDKF